MSVARVPVSWMALALLTRMSMPPKRATACCTASITCASSRISHCTARPRPPACSISATAVWMVPASLGCGSAVLAAITTLAPSRAARRAMARPMPRLPPVMNRVLPLRFGPCRLMVRRSSHWIDPARSLAAGAGKQAYVDTASRPGGGLLPESARGSIKTGVEASPEVNTAVGER